MKLLSTRIFVGLLIVIFILSSLMLVFSYRTIKSHYIETLKEDLKHLDYALREPVIGILNSGDNERLDKYIKELGKNIHTRITVIDTSGAVLADSKKNPKTMENHKHRPELVEALTGRLGSSLRFSSTVKDEMLYVAIPLVKENNRLGALRVSLFLKEIDELIWKITYDILEIASVVLLIAAFVALFFSRNISKPINLLSQASREVGKGDFDVKVFLRRNDEIKELAVNFNNMTEQLKELFTQVKSQKEEFITLIGSINEGLIVVNTDGKIILSNESANSLIPVKDIIGKHFSEVLISDEFTGLFNEIHSRHISLNREIQLFGKYFLCSASIIKTKAEIVFLFHDITEKKKLEQIKKDFVANVSHELRTPLTAIKGYAETLEDELCENSDSDARHYITIIMRHTDRLISIVQDLLALSKLEDPVSKLMVTKVNLKDLIENILKLFGQKLRDKGLSLKLNIDENFPQIHADPFKLEQVILNLVDNAAKYTEDGSIILSVFDNGDNVIITVEDTGLGIPQEDLDRVFERFYLVDKGRSRKVGGTGLGLSIVKHIILLHNGNIKVESTKGVGTKFTITLPKVQTKV